MTTPIDRDLHQFADRHRLNAIRMAHGLSYRIENAPPGFTGRVDCLRIERGGRFGNNFYQLLHATLLAGPFGCSSIEMPPYQCGPEPVTVDGLTFRHAPTPHDIAAPVPTLIGGFFETYHFGRFLRDLTPASVCGTLERHLNPLFRGVRATHVQSRPNSLVMHFRSGDVFSSRRVHPWYVQPPASYYAKAVTYARDALGIEDVVLVFEDRGNPAIALTEAFLRAQDIPFSVQSGHFAADLACLRGARHLVASFGTLCEAAALLSDTLRTYFAFRTLDSQEHIHQRTRPLFPALLVERNVTPILIDDPEQGYIPRLSWKHTQEQLVLLRTYPIDKLTVEPGAWGAVWTGRLIMMLRQPTAD